MSQCASVEFVLGLGSDGFCHVRGVEKSHLGASTGTKFWNCIEKSAVAETGCFETKAQCGRLWA